MVFPPIWGGGGNGDVLSMRMQVILDSSFALPGSVPIWGGKKGKFRDWAIADVVLGSPEFNFLAALVNQQTGLPTASWDS